MDLGKIGKKGLGNLGSGILGNHKKGGIPLDAISAWSFLLWRSAVSELARRHSTRRSRKTSCFMMQVHTFDFRGP